MTASMLLRSVTARFLSARDALSLAILSPHPVH
jgi:hypothetical protein